MHSSETGHETLQTIAKANAFNRWMYETIAPYLKGKLLEVGSGIGNISNYAIKEGHSITLTDINPDYIDLLSSTFSNHSNVDDILLMDLNNVEFPVQHANLYQKFDTVFHLNVLEHIKNDSEAIENCRFLLKAGGTLLILVPAYPFLYSRLDKNLEHYRRYTASSLKKLLTHNGFAVNHSFYFNALGISGWLWNKAFQNNRISDSKMAAFNQLVPIAKLIDRISFRCIGLSVIAVGSKI